MDFVHRREYPLLYAHVSEYLTATDRLRLNSFRVNTLDDTQADIFITKTSLEQHRWISRINMVIRNLITRKLAELNQTLLSSDQILYATWTHERVIHHIHSNRLPEWKALFLVFKGSDLYLFDKDSSAPPLSPYDLMCCTQIYPLVEILMQPVPKNSSLDERQHCVTLTLISNSASECRYINFERKTHYDEFVSNYQRALYMSVYLQKSRAFGCVHQGRICRLVVDVHKGFEMYNNASNELLWTFVFEQLKSSTDNGRDKISFQFQRHPHFEQFPETILLEVQCQYLRLLVHVINAFLTVKLIGQRND